VTTFNFRPDTLDLAIFCMVYFNNEYKLPTRFDSSDVILDIGAHIGSFTFATLVRGAGKVISVEAHPDNVKLVRQHLSDCIASGQVEIHHGAVWRSDMTDTSVSISDFPTINDTLTNTGGATVSDSSAGQPVPTISLDDLIADQHIRLLKLDCEGSEFPILLTSHKLHQVQEIIGEYHEWDGFTVEELLAHLAVQGFTTEHKPHRHFNEGDWTTLPRGYFRAMR